MVGEVGGGWAAALTTLALERRFGAVVGERSTGSSAGRTAREAADELDQHIRTYRWYPQRAGRPDLLAARSRASGVNADPVVRQEAARTEAMVRTSRWTAERAGAARALGRPPGPEGSLGKLAMSEVARAAARAHSLIGGAAGMLTGRDAPEEGIIAEVLVSVPAQSIAGGTDEIQRNILGDRVLGLPHEPRLTD